MTQIERIFIFTTKQESRERTCCRCCKKTHRGDTVHHISQVGAMITLCDDCFNKAKEKEQEE